MTFSNSEDSHSEYEPEPWLEAFIASVGDSIMAQSLMGPLAWHFWQEEELHHLLLYPTTVRFVGGAQDGQEGLPGFSLDVLAVISLFEQVEAVIWTTQGLAPDDEGPRVSIEGLYQGRDVWLRILAEPPAGEAPGMELDVSDFDD